MASSSSSLLAPGTALARARLGLPRLVVAAFVAVACASLAMAWIRPLDELAGDSLMNLYAGRWIWSHGLPHTDPFTIAGEGRTWVDDQWLAHLAYYGAYRLGGLWLAGKLSLAAIIGALVAVWAFLARRGASLAAQVVAPTAVLAMNLLELFPRAQDLVVPLFVALVWIVDDEHTATGRTARRSAISVAWIAGILVLWANLHGSSLMAAGLTLAYGVYRYSLVAVRPGADGLRRAAPWIALIVVALLSVFATPYGATVLDEYRAVLGNDTFAQSVVEWQHAWQGMAIVYAAPSLLFAGTVGLLAARREARVPLPLAACAAVLACATLYEARYALWLAIACAMACGHAAPARRSGPARLGGVRLLLGVLAVAGACLVGRASADTSPARALAQMPVATADVAYAAAKTDPHARILGDLDSSATLLWRHPDLIRRVELDPRLEIYRPATLRDWLRFTRADGAGWFSIAGDADIVLATRAWSRALSDRLERARQGWRPQRTRDGVVLVRSYVGRAAP